MIKKIPEDIKNLNLTKFIFETEPELNIIACAIGTVQCTKHFHKIGKSSLSAIKFTRNSHWCKNLWAKKTRVGGMIFGPVIQLCKNDCTK